MGLKKVVYRWRIGDVNLGDENARDEDLGWKICRWNWWWQILFSSPNFSSPDLSYFFQNSMLFFRISLWIEDIALGRDFDFFPLDRIVVLVVRQVKKTKSQWPEEEVFFNNTKGTTNNPASIFHLLLLDINKGKKILFGRYFSTPLSIPFRESRKGCRCVCVEKF